MKKHNKDSMGQTINIGEQVVFPIDEGTDRLRLKLGTIIGFTDNYVIIKPLNTHKERTLKIFKKVLKYVSF